MTHEVWHVVVLVVVLAGATSGLLLAVGTVVPEIRAGGGPRTRLVLWGMVAASALLLLYEWIKVH